MYYETTRNAQAEAERERGMLEADIIREKGKAEAESRRLLAEAMEEHGEVIIKEKIIEMLPKVAAEFAKPLSAIDSVKVIDSGNGEGVPSFGKSVTKSMVDMHEPLKEMIGFDVAQFLNNMSGASNVKNDNRAEVKTIEPVSSEIETPVQEEK